jgi:hypothetical protein
VRRNFIDFDFAGDQLMRGLGPQRLEQPLDDRVLRWTELRRCRVRGRPRYSRMPLVRTYASEGLSIIRLGHRATTLIRMWIG